MSRDAFLHVRNEMDGKQATGNGIDTTSDKNERTMTIAKNSTKVT